MADNIKKLKYEPGNPVNTSTPMLRCPNGHTLQTHVTKRRGEGRHSCPLCSWNDSKAVMGTTPPVRAQGAPNVESPMKATKGVTVLSHRGVEQRGVPNVISRG